MYINKIYRVSAPKTLRSLILQITSLRESCNILQLSFNDVISRRGCYILKGAK